jgi:hypothetical protein
MQLTLGDVKRRVTRLERLSIGLAQEAIPQDGAVDLLLRAGAAA